MKRPNNRIIAGACEAFALALVGWLLWHFRSWNLSIGDGEFICKLVLGEDIFAITLSRSFLNYLMHLWLFEFMRPVFDWWVEDIIALTSCAAGVVFLGALHRLAWRIARNPWEYAVILLIPSTTLALQTFCGHIEYYSWVSALLALSAYWAWRSIHDGLNPAWSSAALALSAAFHSSGFFYFPAVVLLPLLWNKGDQAPAFQRNHGVWLMTMFALLIATIVLHRWANLFILTVIVALPLYYYAMPATWKRFLEPGLPIYIPWFLLCVMRAALGLRAEELIDHIPPVVGEYEIPILSPLLRFFGLDEIHPITGPYDPGAFHYMFFSWDHLYYKMLYVYWLAPFGFFAVLGYWLLARHRVFGDSWLLYLSNLCFWGLAWSFVFYPQLHERDWDLFVTTSIPLNLFAAYAILRIGPKLLSLAPVIMIPVQLAISMPIIIENSALLTDRGYVTLYMESKPVVTNGFLRGLPVGETPVKMRNIRAGWADVRMIPTERGYASWSQDAYLAPGEDYRFIIELTPAPETLLPESLEEGHNGRD